MWMKMKSKTEVDHALYEEDVVHVVIVLSRESVEFYKVYYGFYTEESLRDALKGWLQHVQKMESRFRTNARYQPSQIYLNIEHNSLHFEGNIFKARNMM